MDKLFIPAYSLKSPDKAVKKAVSLLKKYEKVGLVSTAQHINQINKVKKTLEKEGPSGAIFSALADCYHYLSFQTLTDQVRKSVRASKGNQWMFRVGHAEDHMIRIRPEMLKRPAGSSLYPILCEKTSVRLDLSHSGWSDIFFLGMDYPEGARVINISVDLGVYQRDAEPKPPIETYVRVIDEPILRLTSIDIRL